MSSSPEDNLKFNLSWSFNVDSKFRYLVRFHFCEIAPGIDKSNQRVFSVFLNNMTAEPKADVVGWSGGNGMALHRDFIVDVANDNNIFLILHPNEVSPVYFDDIINGLEIFKINNSDGNLAGPYPLESTGDSTTT
ncbi:Receptor-like protein kinase FERONIA [Raphanus sativus]|nr:Receptor-like protein kinase FERONIA [Raphanus sativus]